VALYIQFNAVGLMLICYGMLGVSVRKMKAQTVKLETVTLIGKNGENVTCLCCMYEIKCKIFFSEQLCYFCVSRLTLESSCIWVNALLYYSHLQLLSRWPFSPEDFMALFILPVHTVQ